MAVLVASTSPVLMPIRSIHCVINILAYVTYNVCNCAPIESVQTYSKLTFFAFSSQSKPCGKITATYEKLIATPLNLCYNNHARML